MNESPFPSGDAGTGAPLSPDATSLTAATSRSRRLLLRSGAVAGAAGLMGAGLLAGGRARHGETVLVPLAGHVVRAEVADPVLYDPEGARRDGT